jgi:hypothetical protein
VEVNMLGWTMNTGVVFLAVVCGALLGCSREAPPAQGARASEFRAGQVWRYRTRTGEEASRLVVCRVEPNDQLGRIIHIHVEGVAITSPASPDGVSHVVGHMPFAEENLRESVMTVEATRTQLPDYEEGYNTWKAAFDSGNAGIFTISVADGLDSVEEALSR